MKKYKNNFKNVLTNIGYMCIIKSTKENKRNTKNIHQGKVKISKKARYGPPKY